MAIGIIELLLGVGSILLLLYYYLIKDFDFWVKRRIPGPKPVPLFGNFTDVMLGKVHQADYLKSIYDTYHNEPVVGIFSRSRPVLLLKDLDIIKDVLIKSFTDFADRGLKIHEDIDPLAQHLAFFGAQKMEANKKKTPAVIYFRKVERDVLFDQRLC